MQNRIQNATINSYYITANHFNEAFPFHGVIMIFLVVIPIIPTTLGNFLLPLMIGAKDVAFPKINLLTYYLYLSGAILLLTTLFLGGVDTGWTFYTPYSTETATAVTTAALGVFVIGFSSILSGVNFIVTVHKLRDPGMDWHKLPLFVWNIYATSIIQILATPILAVTVFLLAIERALGIGIFNPKMGGDPILFQNFFWFYSHPAVYIMILPAFGIISEVVTIHSKRNLFGYWIMVYSTIAFAILSFLVWGHHMFTSGQSAWASVIFSFLTYSVAIPTAIKMFTWLATIYKGAVEFTTPMCFAFVFLGLFLIGGLTGIFLGTLSVNVHLHNTYFVVAHFHYVMMGGSLIAWIAGMFHWWPKITGKKYNILWGNFSALIIFIGFNITFFPQFIMGTRGMPRRYYDYLPQFHTLNVISTIGSWILSLGLFTVFFVWIQSLFSKNFERESNPWKAKTCEWTNTEIIPLPNNFEIQPIIFQSPYIFDQLRDKK